MDLKEILTPALSLALIMGLMAYLDRAASEKITRNNEGQYVLRMSKFYKYFGIGCIPAGVIGFFVPYWSAKQDAFLMGLSILIIMFVTGLLCLLWFVNHRLVFDDKTITSISYLGRRVSIHWSDVEKVKFGNNSGLLSLVDYMGKRVKAHKHLIGFDGFAEEVMRRTKRTAEEIGLVPTTNQF